MERILTSYRFLATTAVCCGVATGLTAWVAGDAPRAARALAVLIALGSTLALLLLIASALASDEASPVPAAPTLAPDAPAPSPSDPGRRELARLLEEGATLRTEVEQLHADSRIDAWIETTREAIEQCRPGLAGYFNALAARSFADDGSRLDAHVKRLGTIVRESA